MDSDTGGAAGCGGTGRSGIGTTTGRACLLGGVRSACSTAGVAVGSASSFFAIGRAGWVGLLARPGDKVAVRLRGGTDFRAV